jgi:hypothetical protein
MFGSRPHVGGLAQGRAIKRLQDRHRRFPGTAKTASLAELTPLRTLTRGRYVLTVTRGGRVLERQTVTVG